MNNQPYQLGDKICITSIVTINGREEKITTWQHKDCKDDLLQKHKEALQNPQKVHNEMKEMYLYIRENKSGNWTEEEIARAKQWLGYYNY